MRPEEVTAISDALARVRDGDAAGGGRLFELLETQLHAIARRAFRTQKASHTLQATAVVNEAYLKFVRALDRGASFEDRDHFLAVAARAMRQVVLNHARDRARQKRGGPDRGDRVTLSDVVLDDRHVTVDALAVHEALEALEAIRPRQARIAELKFFAGLTHEEVARVVGISVRAVEVDWRLTKTFLAARLA